MEMNANTGLNKNGHSHSLATDRVALPVRDEPYTILVRIHQLIPWNGNPPGRTTERSMRDLVDVIRESHHVAELAAVNNGNDTATIGDGHRRWRASNILGIQELQVQIFPASRYTPEQLFKMLNSGTRNQSGTDWLEAHIKSGVLPRKPKLQTDIKFLVRLCGSRQEAKRLVDGHRKISPSAAQTIQWAANLMSQSEKSGAQVIINDTHRAVLDWILQHGQGRLVTLRASASLTDSAKRRRVAKAIKNNTDLDV